MKIIEPGHIYQLNWLDKWESNDSRWNEFKGPDSKHYLDTLVFVNRESGYEHPGTQTQEVIRALIDRTRHCDNCLRRDGNDLIIHHLRMALVLHEARALERKTIKGIITPETVATGDDGHFSLIGSKDGIHRG
jgi:hypothetical protein